MRSLEQEYYQPIRDRAHYCRAIIAFDSSVFIKFAHITTTSFSNGKPTPNSLPHLFEVFPYLANRGFVSICSEMVSWESAHVTRDGSNTSRFYSGSREPFITTNSILQPFFRLASREQWLTILPSLQLKTDHDGWLQDIITIVNKPSTAQINSRGKSSLKGNPKSTTARLMRDEIRSLISKLGKAPDAREISTSHMINDLGSLPCQLFYIASDNEALKMMRNAGAVSLHTLSFLEILKNKKILPLLGLCEDTDDRFIPHCANVIVHRHNPIERASMKQRSAQDIALFEASLGDICNKAELQTTPLMQPKSPTQKTSLRRFSDRYSSLDFGKKS